MAFSLKGLMSEIRPRDIAIGAFGSIQQRFKDDRELDQSRLNNTIASSEGLLEDANTEVQRINKRTELYNQTAEIYGPSVADYLAQTKTFALYDGASNINALKDIDADFISLQRDEGAEACPRWVEQVPLDSWEDTRQATASCDLVISSCTSVSHLAAAMGVETWTVIPVMPYFLYAQEGDTCPYYDTMKLFRQEFFGDWEAPFNKIKERLGEKKALRRVK